MFQEMKKKGQSWVIMGIFAAIIITFVFGFGVDPQGCASSPNFVAQVNGDTIAVSEYKIMYNNLYDFYQRIYPNFNNKVAKQLGLSKRAMDSLIDTVLLSQNAASLGFHVSDKEIADTIVNTKYFQTNNKFDKELYSRIVQHQFNSSIKKYEEKMRRELLAQKLRSFLDASIEVSNKEMEEDFIITNEKVAIEYITFSEETLKKEAKDNVMATLNEKAVKDFAAKEAKRIKMFYDDNTARFKKEAEVKASHILVKLEKDKNEAEAKKKIEEVLKEAKAGKDFAELAKKHSEGPSAPKGGDLGFFGKGRMVPEFEKAAFAMKKGEISDVVKTKFGFHVIKLVDRKDASEKKLEEVTDEIAREMLSKDKLVALYSADANKLLSLLRNGQYNIDDVKKDFPDWNLEKKDAKDIKKNAKFIKGIGIEEVLVKKVFSYKNVPGYLKEVVKTDSKAMVVKVASHIPADMKKFEDEKESIRSKMKSMKSQGVVGKYIEDLRKISSIRTNEQVISGFGSEE